MAELKSHAAKYFEVILKFLETQEHGDEKMVKKTIVVDAISFSEAESKAINEFSCYGELEVVNINPAQYNEIFSSSDYSDDKYFKAKLEFITLDERTEKEKRSKVMYLVQAKSIARALHYVDDVMAKTMIDYDSVGIVATDIYDVYFHESDS
jgi:hypothetical protein